MWRSLEIQIATISRKPLFYLIWDNTIPELKMVTIHITIFQWGLKVVSDKLIGTILHKILLIRKVYRYRRFSNVFHDLQTYFQQPVSERKKMEEHSCWSWIISPNLDLFRYHIWECKERWFTSLQNCFSQSVTILPDLLWKQSQQVSGIKPDVPVFHIQFELLLDIAIDLLSHQSAIK